MTKPQPMTAAERQARSRRQRREQGGATLSVMLTPEALSKLARWIERGETGASIINRLLTRSKP